MCGICGFWLGADGELSNEEVGASILAMTRRLSHRGPDHTGAWVEPKAGVALGHARLSILDLSEAGHQPMLSRNGRYALVMNGEIYNFPELRRRLENSGHTFSGRSDTEVMLETFSKDGVEKSLRLFVGMFAFALWDRHTRTLHLGRDRVGEKPLYFGWVGNAFLFASEIRAFKSYPHWSGDICSEALPLLITHNCIPAPYSIYRNVWKLLPGCHLSLTQSHMDRRCVPCPQSYWAPQILLSGTAPTPTAQDSDAIDQLEFLLRQSVAGQMVADVPLGAFLSGGVDSATIVALAQSQSATPVKTFTIGFESPRFNEAHHAAAIARHLGTDHTELYVSMKELCETVPELARIYDEPFSDPAQIPTCLLCQLARRQVSVCLSGDGGDEVFGGYRHYSKTELIWKSIRWAAGPVRARLGSVLESLSLQCLESPLSSSYRMARLFNRIVNFSQVLSSPTFDALYKVIRSQCRHAGQWLRHPALAESSFTKRPGWENIPVPLRQMMLTDTLSFLPEDILVKVDRAAMAVSLETRIPMLDHRIVEFAWRLPVTQLRQNGQGKYLLRKVLEKYVPAALIDRPKKGFGPPIAEWLAGPLRGWAEELLSEARLGDSGLFHQQNVRGKWHEHVAKKRNWSQPLWSVLMFQAWAENEKKPSPLRSTYQSCAPATLVQAT